MNLQIDVVPTLGRMRSGSRCATLLAVVSFILASAPAVAQPRPIGTSFTISADSGNDAMQGKPAIAASPAQFFVVYRKFVNQPGNAYDIYGTRVALDGTVLDPAGIPISTAQNFDSGPGNQYLPSVGFDGTNYMVVWVENRNPLSVNYELFAARVAINGTVLDPAGIQITQSAGGPSSPLRMPTIAFDGTNYLVAWRSSPGQIWATRITPAGVNLDGPNGSQVGAGFYPYAAFDGTNFLVVWHAGSGQSLNIMGALVSTNGAVASGPFEIAPVESGKDHTSVAFDGSNYLVVWHDFRGGNAYNDGSAYGTRVSPAAQVLDNPSIKIADYVRGQVSVRVVFDGANHFVVWQEDNAHFKYRNTDVFGRRVSPGGVVLDQRSVAVAASQGHQFAPVIAFNSGRYLAAWGESTSTIGGQLLGPGVSPAAPLLAQSPVNAGWTAEASPVSQALFDVFGFTDRDVFAVGEDGVVVHSAGSGWTFAQQLQNSRKYSVWGSAPQDLWVVGWCGDVFLNDGSQWDRTDCLLNSIGTGIWATGRSNIVMVGADGNIFQYQAAGIGTTPQLDRGNWQQRSSGVAVDLWDVWGTAHDNILTVGELGTILRFDGTAWQPVANVPSDHGLNGIWGRNAADVFVVGDSGTVLHYNGATWSLQPTPTKEHLLSVWGCSTGHAYAVGANGTILHYDGTQWLAEASGTARHLFGVWGRGRSVIAVGDQGTILRKITACSPVLANDANGDGKSDVFWRHANGTTLLWQMNGTAISGAGSPASVGNVGWEVAGIGDFNGDGKADILWRNAASGTVLVWLMNGSVISGAGSPATVDASWQVQGVGDFNGDGKADILWKHSNGTVLMWLMNGTSLASAGSPATVTDTDWAVQGVGDFDGDGNADVLWKHNLSGTVFVWRMNGASILSTASPATVGGTATGWEVQGVADFDGDGKADILWKHAASGVVYTWLMNGGAIAGTGSPATVGNVGWDVKGVGDYDGDGRADVLWQNSSSGTTFVWRMNGVSILGTGSPATVSDPNWQVQNPK